tara:strand:+ start:58829 stop:59941 length:1113 start_codon:yes stop_codon:yes gene_type:complete
MNPLDLLIEDGIIDLMLTRLKSGKEADVFLVDRGSEVLVAKVYKNKAHRSFKNNAEYKEGRKVRNTRTQRAMNSRSKFGREASEDEWKNTEAATLNNLYSSGVRVPKPVMFYEGVLLMELVLGADGCPAPRLIEVAYEADKAKEHYLDLRGQMIRMLCGDLIHGDLSPYNILDAKEGPTIIDFPQIVSAAHTNRAAEFFLRDFNNVLDFLVKANASLQSNRGDGRKIWQAYASRRLTPGFVPSASSPNTQKRNRPRHGAAKPTGLQPDSKRRSRPSADAPRRGGNAKPASSSSTRGKGPTVIEKRTRRPDGTPVARPGSQGSAQNSGSQGSSQNSGSETSSTPSAKRAPRKRSRRRRSAAKARPQNNDND